MRLRSLLPAMLLGTLVSVHATAQDGGLATVVSRDGATKMVLTSDHIAFLFTERGARAIENGVSARSAATLKRDSWMVGWMGASVLGGVRGMRMRFDLATVREIRFADGALTLYRDNLPDGAPGASDRGRFVFRNVPEQEARVFVREFARLKARS
jgi:hypothetical protein